MSDRLEELARVMRLVQEDCRADALALDGSVFNGRVVGERFGATLAAVDACARGIELLADEMAAMRSESVA